MHSLRRCSQVILGVLSSYGLAAVVLLLLVLLALIGTIHQGELGLYEAQRRYFTSFIAEIHTGISLGGRWELVVPLPGGELLMWILAANLLVGGMVRMRKSRRTVGIIIIHIGIAMMLLAGFVKHYRADEGHLTLWPNEVYDKFQSWHRWELVIETDAGDGDMRQWKIPHGDLVDLGRGQTRTFTHAELPFDLRISHWMPNCEPRRKGPMFDVPVPVTDGFYLRELPLHPTHEANIAGAYVTLVDKSGGPSVQGIVRGAAYWQPSSAARNPFVVRVHEQPFAIELRRERYDLPFAIRLEKFTAEFHPGTSSPSNYQSKVTKIQGGVETPVVIRMNEPLRQGDYVLFQADYGPKNAPPGVPMFSQFSVVRNPSDRWPGYALGVIAMGLLIHFGTKLWRYMRSEQRRMA